MKKLQLVAFAVAATCGLASAEAQTVNFTAGTPVTIGTSLNAYSSGLRMTGLSVLWTFVGGGGGSGVWGDLTDSYHGVSLDGFRIDMLSTGNSYRSPWRITNLTGFALATVQLNGAPGNTVFDCTYLGTLCTGLVGSVNRVICYMGRVYCIVLDQNGEPITVVDCSQIGTECGELNGNEENDLTANLVGTQGSDNGGSAQSYGTLGTTATFTYSNLVGLGAPPVGDLFEQLLLEFDGGLQQQGTYSFIADTDYGQLVPPPQTSTVVPEPSTYALLAAGLAALAVVRRRRQVTA